MSYYRKVTYTDAATEGSLNLDPSIVPFNVFVVTTVTGTLEYKMQLSLDPLTVSDSAATWFDSTDIPAASTASKMSSITTPIARVRFVIASNTGSLQVQIRQGLSTN